jgi:hypothetical protein
MKKPTSPVIWNEISVTVGEIKVTGEYSVDRNDWMTVRMNGGGSKSARGGRAVDSTARIILHELYNEENRLTK